MGHTRGGGAGSDFLFYPKILIWHEEEGPRVILVPVRRWKGAGCLCMNYGLRILNVKSGRLIVLSGVSSSYYFDRSNKAYTKRSMERVLPDELG